MDSEWILAVVIAVLGAMALAWFACIRRLAALLRARHEETADELSLEEIFPQRLADWVLGYDNRAATMALLGFLWRREYRRLRDRRVARLARFMRHLAIAYVLLFGGVFVGMASHFWRHADAPEDAAQAEPVAQESEADVTHRRGYEHQRAGRLDLALVEYRRLMDLSPGNIDAYRGANTILLGQKRYADCLDLWNRYLRVFPGDAEGLYERSRAHFLLGDRAAAMEDAKRACAAGKAEACSAASRLEAQPSAK